MIKLNYYELILTEDCNMRCSYCFDDNYSNRSDCNPESKMKISLIDDLFKFIENTYDKEGNEIIVSFFGGEPLMNFEFIKAFINRAKEELSNIMFRYVINTNFLLMTTEIMDFLIENKIGPNISLDGREKSHDINRVTIGKEKTWEKIMKKLPEFLIKCRKNNINPGFLMVVNETNYNDLVQNYLFLLTLSDKINILFDTNKDICDEMLESIKKSLEILFVKNRNILPTDFILKYMNKNYIENYNSSCFIPDKNVSINPSGRLFFCHQVVPKMYKITNDFKEYYGDIINGYTNKEYYDKMVDRTNFNVFKEKNECKVCDIKWCKGGCFGSHRFYSESICGLNKNICKINKVVNDICNQIS